MKDEGVVCVKQETWRDLVKLHLNARLRQGRAEVTTKADRKVLMHFLWFLERQQVERPSDLTRQHLESWEDYLENDYRSRHKGLLITSVTRYGWTSSVLLFVGFLVHTDRLVIDPRVGFDRSRLKRNSNRMIPTEEEVDIFLETIQGPEPVIIRDRAIFELLYSTGLRRGELCRLDLYDVDVTAFRVTVRQGKGGFDRVVPLGRTVATFLRSYLVDVRHYWWQPKAGDALFVTEPGNRLTGATVGRRCLFWARETRLPHITPHRLRHACATHMLRAGADIRHVQVLLGHQVITTTQQYTHLVNSDLKDTHRRSHPRGS